MGGLIGSVNMMCETVNNDNVDDDSIDDENTVSSTTDEIASVVDEPNHLKSTELQKLRTKRKHQKFRYYGPNIESKQH